MKSHVYDQIDTERQMQLAQDYSPAFDDLHNQNDWVAILVRHLGLAADDGGQENPDRFRRQMVRLGALAVAAVEAFDRKHGKVIDQTHRGSGV